MSQDDTPLIHWTDPAGLAQQARWRSLAGHPAPTRVVLADDTLNADAAFRLAEQGCGLLWCGVYQNARHLLQALGRRVDAAAAAAAAEPRRSAGAGGAGGADLASAAPSALLHEAFLAQRRLQARRARILGQLLLPFDADHGVPLRRAPDLRAAGLQAHGPVEQHYVANATQMSSADI